MANPIIRKHDLATGEIIDREMTDEELKVYKTQQKANATAQAETNEKMTARENAEIATL